MAKVNLQDATTRANLVVSDGTSLSHKHWIKESPDLCHSRASGNPVVGVSLFYYCGLFEHLEFLLLDSCFRRNDRCYRGLTLNTFFISISSSEPTFLVAIPDPTLGLGATVMQSHMTETLK